MLTVNQMVQAVAARHINNLAKTEDCVPEEMIRSLSYGPEHASKELMEYKEGAEILEHSTVVFHWSTRSTIKPTPADNQVVVDAGWIANSPAYILATVTEK